MAPDELAGRLREQVSLLKATDTTDAFGARVPLWAVVATLAAAVEAEPLGRADVAGRAGHRVRYRITVRRRADIRPAMRLAWRGRMLEIEAVTPDRPDAPQMILLALEVPGT